LYQKISTQTHNKQFKFDEFNYKAEIPITKIIKVKKVTFLPKK